MKEVKYRLLSYFCFGALKKKLQEKYKKAKKKKNLEFIKFAEEYYGLRSMINNFNMLSTIQLPSIYTDIKYIKRKLIVNQVKSNITFLGKKLKKRGKLRVAFFVIWASQFTSSRIYEMMLEDPVFEPFIVICRIPDMSNEDQERFQTVFGENLAAIRAKYGDVRTNWENGKYIDLSDEFDIAVYHMMHPYLYDKFCQMPYLTNKGILSVFIPYGIHIAASSESEMLAGTNRYEFLSYTLIYIDNKIVVNKIKTLYENTKYFGYPKVDKLAVHKQTPHERPIIILAPHQDLYGVGTAGTFLETYPLYIEVPKLFPDIDFVFRPHPLWLPNLKLEWGEKRASSYLNQVISLPNIRYSTEDDYYQIFADSDAMIHDCGTFLAEYMFTEKPSLYLKDDETVIENSFSEFAKQVIKHTYLGHTIDDVVQFIQEVVIQKKDFMKDSRLEFLRSELYGDYPNTSESILKDLKEKLIEGD